MNGAGGENEKDSGNSSGGKDGGVISYREVVPPKFARTDSYPFRMPSSFSRSTENGPTFYNVSHLYDAAGSAVAGAAAVAARTVQPFLTAFKSPGMASLRFPFTSAQWQELEQQALICKYLMAAMPIPPELVIPFRKSLANAVPIITSHSNLGWGSFNLRFSGSSDPEPGRCRRTDGKKWRCSRDVAPDQKYCERHMHRGRPRSRKHVEVQVQNKPSTASSNQALTTSTSQISANGGIFTKPSCGTDFKLPLQTLVPEKDSSRSLNWMEGDIADPNHQWDLYNSKHGETQQLCKSSSNDCFFLNTDLGSLERDSTQRQEQSERGFIDAWSQVRGSSDQSSVGNNKHSLSSLSLSMSHGEMGSLGVENDCEQDSPAAGVKPATQPLNWMIPVSWQQSPTLGGPLAEVLGSSTGAANSPSRKGGCIEKSWYDGDGAGLNLMSNGWREVSPRDSPRLVSSPSGVLQKTLASLSDSSSGSSHTFAAKSDIALQWLNQEHK